MHWKRRGLVRSPHPCLGILNYTYTLMTLVDQDVGRNSGTPVAPQPPQHGGERFVLELRVRKIRFYEILA
jgi:hypothetical protein